MSFLRTTCLTASRFAVKNNHITNNSAITNSTSKLITANSNLSRSIAIRFKSSSSVATAEHSLKHNASTLKPKASATATTESSQSQSLTLAQTAFAAIAGIATVSLAAAIVESTTASSVPEFDPTDPSTQRFDQSTFQGRFCRMILECDPRLLTYTEEETKRSKDMVLNYKSLLQQSPKDGDNVMTRQQMHHALWEAQRISSASLHPDTNEIIPQPFRMSGYVPCNGPVCVAMVASTSTPALLFWSWVNQSQNALVNYYNRNACSEMSNQTLVLSYSAAVVSSLSLAFGLATLIQRRYDANKAKQLMKWVAFPSAVVASSLNCYIVRSPEIETGIPLLNEHMEDVAPGKTSQIAARKGVNSTTASRAILQAPVYFLPPVLIGTIPFLKRIVATNPALRVPLTTYLVLVSFGLGLPATVSIFPQMAEIDVADLEEEFQGLRSSSGNGSSTPGMPYQKLYYNKGL